VAELNGSLCYGDPFLSHLTYLHQTKTDASVPPVGLQQVIDLDLPLHIFAK
jgi:hypothetical protein